MATWDDILTSRDKEVFAKSGYGKRGGFGRRECSTPLRQLFRASLCRAEDDPWERSREPC